MERKIKQDVTTLWQDTANRWKDGAASQYHNNAIVMIEGMLDRFGALNRDLDHKINEAMREIQKYENF